jgi:putative acetyltransferase
LEPLGLVLKFIEPGQWAGWQMPGNDRPLFIVGRPLDGQSADAGNGQMIALAASSHDAVRSAYEAAMEAGGTDEGKPGWRRHYHPNYYGAYFRDLDGNKICVVCHDPAGIFSIQQDDLSGQPTRDLLAAHLAGMHANSPPGSVFALDLSGLQRSDVTVWAAWEGTNIAGIAALRGLSGGIGEVKSMRTHPDYLRRGVARRLLGFILAEARALGMKKVCLETGSGPDFEPALALYSSFGFSDGPAFGDYAPNAFSTFLHRGFGAIG